MGELQTVSQLCSIPSLCPAQPLLQPKSPHLCCPPALPGAFPCEKGKKELIFPQIKIYCLVPHPDSWLFHLSIQYCIGYHQPACHAEPLFSIILPQIYHKMQGTPYFIINPAFTSLYFIFLILFSLNRAVPPVQFHFAFELLPISRGIWQCFRPPFCAAGDVGHHLLNKLHISRSELQRIRDGNAFCWKFPQPSYLQSQIPLAGARCRDESTEEGSFWDGVEKTLHNCSEEVPSPSQPLVFILDIQNKGRGAWVGGFSPTLTCNDSPSPTTGCMGTVTHRCVGTCRVDFYPSRNLLENLLLVLGFFSWGSKDMIAGRSQWTHPGLLHPRSEPLTKSGKGGGDAGKIDPPAAKYTSIYL